MNKSSFIPLICLLASANAWINGINMPWNACGNDFGAYYDTATFKEALNRYHNSGANVARLWIHFDGAKEMKLYDSNGYF